MIVYNEIIYELRQARKTTARQLIYWLNWKREYAKNAS